MIEINGQNDRIFQSTSQSYMSYITLTCLSRPSGDVLSGGRKQASNHVHTPRWHLKTITCVEKSTFYGVFLLKNHIFSFVHKNWSICRIVTRHPWKSSPWSQVSKNEKIKWFAHTGTFWRLFKGAQIRRLIAPSFDYKFVPVGANHFIFYFF